MKITREMLERIVKSVIAYNGGSVEFDKSFLKLFDDFALSIKEHGDTITLRAKQK